MTVHDRLLELGANPGETSQAEALILSSVAVGRPVVVTEEILVAARAGDAGLVATLLAEEVDPDPEDLAALNEAARVNDGSTKSLAEVRAHLQRNSVHR